MKFYFACVMKTVASFHPDCLFEAAERYGITLSIDRWVIRGALRWLVSEADERERLVMCLINLSCNALRRAPLGLQRSTPIDCVNTAMQFLPPI